MNAQAIKLVIKLWHDDCPEDPCETDGWKVHSFSRRHGNYKHPHDVGFYEDDDGDATTGPELQAKLDSGLAFCLSYYEHGLCAWSLYGEGPQCRWDTTQFAGILVWEQDEENLGPKTLEERTKDAKAFVERYTSWCNGEVYGYTIEAYSKCPTCGQDEEAEADFDLPSCGGYYPDDVDGMVIDIKDHIGSDWADYEVKFEEHHAYGLADEVKSRWKGE